MALPWGAHASPDDPRERALEEVLAAAGMPAALDRLGVLAAADPTVVEHQFAHLLGSAQYRRLGADLDAAFRGCDVRFQGGCFHGTLQEHFRTLPAVDGATLRALCDRLSAGQSAAVHANCAHGVGHGLYIHFDQQITEPLRHCGLLTEAERAECRGGVFMENLVTTMTGHGHSDGPAQVAAFRPADPHYPCDTVDADARSSCYLYQPVAVLYLNGGDVAGAFSACDRAAAADVPACYFGMGGAIGALTGRDVRRSDDLCRLGAPAYQGWCFENLVEIQVNTTLSTARAIAQCDAAPAWFARRCVEVVADRVGWLWPDRTDQARECGRFAGGERAERCRGLAGL